MNLYVSSLTGSETLFCIAESEKKYAIVKSKLEMTKIEADYWVIRQALKTIEENSTIIVSSKIMPNLSIDYVCEAKQINIIWKPEEENIAERVLKEKMKEGIKGNG